MCAASEIGDADRPVCSHHTGVTRVQQAGRTTQVAQESTAQRALLAAYAGRERGLIRPTRSPPSRLLGVVRESLRLRRYSARTGDAYVAWIRRYVRFCECRHPQTCGAAEVRAFLSMLATAGR